MQWYHGFPAELETRILFKIQLFCSESNQNLLGHPETVWVINECFFANCSMTSIKLSSMFLYYFFFCGSRSTMLPVIFRHAFFCWHSILAVKAVVFFHVIFFWNFPFGLFTEALSDKALKAWANKYSRWKSYKSPKKNWATHKCIWKVRVWGQFYKLTNQTCCLVCQTKS